MLGKLWVRLLVVITVVLGIAVITVAVFVNLTTTSQLRDYGSEGTADLSQRHE